jgi:DNA replication protein DnaC
MPKKYLTKSDKTFKRVNPEYALKQAEKHKEASWLNEHRQNVINTLPKRLAANFDSYDFTNIKHTGFKSVFIHGKAGVGKSVLSAYLYLEFVHELYIKRGTFSSIRYNYVIFPKWVELMQNRFNKNGIIELNSSSMQDYITSDILVLDDFGVKKITDYVYSMIYSIINERYLTAGGMV